MRDLLILAIHLLVTLAKLLRPGGARRVAAESLLLKHQLLISNRFRRRAPNLTMIDRLVLGLTTIFVSPHRISKLSVSIRPATLLKFHKALVHRKYRRLFSSSHQRRKPGPKGPSEQLIAAIVAMKHRNPKFGCVRIAQQIAHAFGIEIDKDVVRRVLATRARPKPDSDGPSWLTLIAQAKDSVWSVDLFRVESVVLRSHWVLLVMDIFTRRIIGFGITCPSSKPGPTLKRWQTMPVRHRLCPMIRLCRNVIETVRADHAARRALVWECVALRHQLAVLGRLGTRRPRFRPIDRLFWVFMSWCGRPGATHSWCVW